MTPSITSQPPRLTLATALWLSATMFIAFSISNGILLDWLGWQINSGFVFFATLSEMGAVIFYLRRARRIEIIFDRAELRAFLLLVALVAAYLIYPALPGLLPPARHFDAVNHTIQTQFIFEQNALPHDFSGAVPPYYMSGYPAGGALFAALVAHWLGAQPIQTLHPIIAIILALAAGLVFIFTHHVLRDTLDGARHTSQIIPIAFLSTFLLFTAWAYFPGSVNERYFYAQNVAQFFALATFFCAYNYFTSGDTLWFALMPFALSLVLVSHPTPIVAPLLASFIAILSHPHTHLRDNLTRAIILALALIPVAIIYVVPHLAQWIALTGYGEASPFDLESIGIILPTLSIIGIFFALKKEFRSSFGFVFLLALCVLAQPAALYLARFFLPAISPYYFEKSVYLLIYPLALLAALPLKLFTNYVSRYQLAKSRDNSREISFWFFLFAFSFLLFALFPPRPFAPLTANELRVAQWTKQNLDPRAIAVVSGIREDAYWVQWPILGNGPTDRATAGAYHLGSMTYEEWRGNPRAPDYAIIRNLARVPSDASTRLLYVSGESAVAQKPRGEIPAARAPQNKTAFAVGDILNLVGYETANAWTPGAAFTIIFFWQTREWPVTRTNIFAQIVDPQGNVITRAEDEIFQRRYPTDRYPLGVTLEDEWNFQMPRDARAGDYRVEVVLYSQLTGDRIEVNEDGKISDQINLRGVRVSAP